LERGLHDPACPRSADGRIGFSEERARSLSEYSIRAAAGPGVRWRRSAQSAHLVVNAPHSRALLSAARSRPRVQSEYSDRLLVTVDSAQVSSANPDSIIRNYLIP
jgi:hypothetical protein